MPRTCRAAFVKKAVNEPGCKKLEMICLTDNDISAVRPHDRGVPLCIDILLWACFLRWAVVKETSTRSLVASQRLLPLHRLHQATPRRVAARQVPARQVPSTSGTSTSGASTSGTSSSGTSSSGSATNNSGSTVSVGACNSELNNFTANVWLPVMGVDCLACHVRTRAGQSSRRTLHLSASIGAELPGDQCGCDARDGGHR